jgi:hypothetical protein
MSIRGALVTARPGLVVRHLAPVDELVCDQGACLHARPNTPCDCRSCYGRDHGAKSLLAPAACGDVRVLRDIVGPGDIRWAACPGAKAGCPDVTAEAGTQAFARLAVGGGLYVEDEPW